MKRFLSVVVVFGLLLVSVSLVAAEFSPWARVRGSYQFQLNTDFSNKSAFDIDRARLGMDGEFAENFYFKLDIDAKNTKAGKGAELKAAFISWNFHPLHWLEVGAITTTFTRGLSGLEYAFINYDITTSLDAYQYGIQVKGLLFDGFLSYFVSASDGEGYKTVNVGNGLLYMGRIELQLLGVNTRKVDDEELAYFADLREGATKRDTALVFGAAFAFDNKFESPDYGHTFESFNGTHLNLDLTFRMAGLSVFAQGNYNSYGEKYNGAYWGGVNKNVRESYGGFGQIGYNIGDIAGGGLEPMVKYEWWKDIVNEGADDITYNKQNLAVGVNWYFKEHNFKLNLEYRRALRDDYEPTYIIRPAENYLGLRLTQAFSSPRIK